MNPLCTPTQAQLRLVASCTRAPARPEAGFPAAQGPAPLSRLPLFHRPGRVAVLAEDPGLVDALARSLPRRWRVRPFLCPTSCLYALQQEPPAWEHDLWAQQDLVARWREGAPLLPQVLRYWACTPQRRALTSVAVVDALMAGMGGVDLFAELVDWAGHRVLMAGGLDPELARRAVEDGRIDRFVSRRDHSLRADLVRTVDGLLARPSLRHDAVWAATLQPQQLRQLHRPGVADDLQSLLQAHCVEWVVLGEPFGVLGLDAGGHAHWLQLQCPAELDALAERAGAAGLPADAAQRVRSGRQLPNLDLRACLDLPGTDLLPARQLGGPHGLLAASTRIDITSGWQPLAAARPAGASRRLLFPLFPLTRELVPVPAAG